MRRWRDVLVALILFGLTQAAPAQPAPPSDEDARWTAFITWFKAAPLTANPLEGYAAKLQGDGKTEAEAKREVAGLTAQLGSRSDWIGIYFDKAFARPLTGKPWQDGFNTQPNALVVEAVKGLQPGAALDAGMGQGRNAVYLASQGWRVTGFDISEQALAAAKANAAKAGVQVSAVKASYDEFDFGSEQWDLIALVFAWAPAGDPAFVQRLRASLRPGGLIVFEHHLRPPEDDGPNPTRKLRPNELRTSFSDFDILSYEESDGTGDWGGPGSRLVRMIAKKRSAG